MLTLQEKRKIKDILGDGLNINRNINFPYFLDCIEESKNDIKSLERKLDMIYQKQSETEYKLDMIINLLRKKI